MMGASRTKKLKRSRLPDVLLLVLAAILFFPGVLAEGRSAGSGRPLLYNLIVKEGDPVDQMIRELYSGKYEIVEVRNPRSYSSPKLTKSRFPNPVFDDANMEVAGSVRVCFVITTDGRLVDPHVYGSANPLLKGPVLEVLKEFRAIPARVNGAPVAVVDGAKFTFGPPPRRRIDTYR